MKNYYVIIENTEEETLFEGWVENVTSIEDLKMVIEVSYKIVLGRYYIATKKPIDFWDNCIVFHN